MCLKFHLQVPLTSPFLSVAPLNFLILRVNSTVGLLNPFLIGTKNGNVDGACKRSLNRAIEIKLFDSIKFALF